MLGKIPMKSPTEHKWGFLNTSNKSCSPGQTTWGFWFCLLLCACPKIRLWCNGCENKKYLLCSTNKDEDTYPVSISVLYVLGYVHMQYVCIYVMHVCTIRMYYIYVCLRVCMYRYTYLLIDIWCKYLSMHVCTICMYAFALYVCKYVFMKVQIQMQ